MEKYDVKNIVKEKYAKIALQSAQNSGCSCCCSNGDNNLYKIIEDEYSSVDGYIPEADLGLGCGIPTEFALIKEGNAVLDLGSGAGNDVFVARSIVGESGKVIGIDFTDEMIQKANENKAKLGFGNVEFLKGEIEAMPLPDSSVDVVISNCVLNLVPDKEKAFSEIFRVLKPGGHFCVSDIVLNGVLPPNIKKSAEMYAGCIAGAIQKNDYEEIIHKSGFKNIIVHKEKKISIPAYILLNFIDGEELDNFLLSDNMILSITVSGHK